MEPNPYRPNYYYAPPELRLELDQYYLYNKFKDQVIVELLNYNRNVNFVDFRIYIPPQSAQFSVDLDLEFNVRLEALQEFVTVESYISTYASGFTYRNLVYLPDGRLKFTTDGVVSYVSPDIAKIIKEKIQRMIADIAH